jgi:hypothetical protein
MSRAIARKRLAAYAFVLAVMLGGLSTVSASATTLPAAPRTSTQPAPLAPQDHPCCQYRWLVIRVSSPYTTQGRWWTCAPRVDNDGYNGTWGCNNSFTVANSVSGTVTASDGEISAAVGFSVTHSWTQGQTYNVTPGRDWYGVLQAANVYSTRTVTQGEQVGYLTPPYAWTWMGVHATAYAHRFTGWTYQPVRYSDD